PDPLRPRNSIDRTLCSAATNRKLSAFLSESDLRAVRGHNRQARATIGGRDPGPRHCFRIGRDPKPGGSLAWPGAAAHAATGETSARAQEEHQVERACVGEVSALARTAFALDSGSSVARGQSFEPGTGSAGCPARHHRPDGGGGRGSSRDTANEPEYGVGEGMRGGAVCQAGTDPRAD